MSNLEHLDQIAREQAASPISRAVNRLRPEDYRTEPQEVAAAIRANPVPALLNALKQLGACWQQANLCSTASDQQRRDFITRITDAWNDHAAPAITALEDKGQQLADDLKTISAPTGELRTMLVYVSADALPHGENCDLFVRARSREEAVHTWRDFCQAEGWDIEGVPAEAVSVVTCPATAAGDQPGAIEWQTIKKEL